MANNDDIEGHPLLAADIDSCTVRGIEAFDCTFTNVRIINPKLHRCTLINCQVIDHNDIEFSTVRGCRMEGGTLDGSTVSSGVRPIPYSQLKDVLITNSKIQMFNIRDCRIYKTSLDDCKHGAEVITNSILERCELNNCLVDGGQSNLSHSRAVSSTFKKLTVSKSVFTKLEFAQCHVNSSAIALCVIASDTSFFLTVINSSNIDRCDVSGCCPLFRGSKTRYTTFIRTRISQSTIRRSVVYQSALRTCDLVQTSENVKDDAMATNFSNYDITNTILKDLHSINAGTSAAISR